MFKNDKFMFKNFSIVPRWVIFLIDIGATLFSFLLAIAIRQNLTLIGTDWAHVINSIGLLLIINTLVFNAIKTYSGIVRYTGLQDAIRIAVSILASSVMLFLINTVNLCF
jgi:FlaA1/EpsC-like NDP-sugar epimerase